MKRLFNFAKTSLPKISKTEQIALESGTVGIEGLIFKGLSAKSSLNKYFVEKYKRYI